MVNRFGARRRPLTSNSGGNLPGRLLSGDFRVGVSLHSSSKRYSDTGGVDAAELW